MKIIIQEAADKKPMIIRIPTRGVITGLGPIAIAYGSTHISSSEMRISFRQARGLCRALVEGRKVLKGEPMVEVQSSGGESVVIYL